MPAGRQEPRGTGYERGVVLLAALMVMVVLSLYLPAYVTWAIWDQRNLIRQHSAAEAHAVAQAGLNRAVLDLYLDNNSWLDGDISGHTVHVPDSGDTDKFWTLSYTNWTLGNGSYTIQIRYPYNTATGKFYDKRMWVRSTGNIANPMTGFTATATLEQFVNYYMVKNIGQDPDNPSDDKLSYTSLQPAINDALANDNLAIAATTLNENISINKNLNIRGCYAPCFTFRSCSGYHTLINGNWTVTGGAIVTLSGITID